MGCNLVTNLASTATLILTTAGASEKKVQALRDKNIAVLLLPDKQGIISFKHILSELGKQGLTSLLIEGGAGVNGIALRSALVDRVIFYIAPKLLCGEDALGVVAGKAISPLSAALMLENVKMRCFGEDMRIEGRLKK